MIAARLAIMLALASISSTAWAQEKVVDIPAGRAGRAAGILARQTGTSIIVADDTLARRHVPAIDGRYSVEAAVRQLAAAANGAAVRVGSQAWKIVARPRRQRRLPARPPREPSAKPPPPEIPAPPIIVTASKRDARLGQFAGKADIVDGALLESGGIGGTDRLERNVAALSSTHLGAGRNKLFIRGIGDSSFTGNTQATVGQYFGDLRLGYNAPDPDLRLIDIDRVEVLEGPQGSLYGAGSLGGIIRTVPEMPDPTHREAVAIGGVSLTRHGEPGGDLAAIVNLPLATDRTAIRMAAYTQREGGYIDKPLQGVNNANRATVSGGRLIARQILAPQWTVDLIAMGQTIDVDDSQYTDGIGPPLTRSTTVRENYATDFLNGQMVVTGRIGDVRLKSSTGLTDQRIHERFDATPPNQPLRVLTRTTRTNLVANETRAWRPFRHGLGWVAGASFFRNGRMLTRELVSPPRGTDTDGIDTAITEFSLYGEVQVALRKGLTGSAGGRAAIMRLSEPAGPVAQRVDVRSLGYATRRTEKVFLPSVALTAELSPDHSLYLRYDESFRPGGFSSFDDALILFRNDRVSTFEVGARAGQQRAGPFFVAASVSYSRWRNIQADFIDPSGQAGTANIGDGRILSASLSGTVRLARGLRAQGGFVLNDSDIRETQSFLLEQRLDRIPNIANFTGRAALDYAGPIGKSLDLTGRIWLSYIGRSRLGIGPELGALQGNVLDSGLTMRVGRDRWGVTVDLANLFDAKGNRFALGTPFATGREQKTPLRPTTLRIGMDWRF